MLLHEGPEVLKVTPSGHQEKISELTCSYLGYQQFYGLGFMVLGFKDLYILGQVQYLTYLLVFTSAKHLLLLCHIGLLVLIFSCLQLCVASYDKQHLLTCVLIHDRARH